MTESTHEMRSYDQPGQLLDKHDTRKNYYLATRPHPICCSKRFLVLILMFLGFFFGILVKVCINIAIIEMTANKTSVNQTSSYSYNWDTKTTGVVLSTHAYGFLFSPIGGYLATKFGGSVTYGTTTMLMSILTSLNPASLECNFHLFLACRIATGLFDGFAYASSAEIFSRWVPTKERSTFMAIVFSGIYIGIAIAYPMFGYIARFWGWKMIFYITGVSTFIWSVVWLIVVRNEPSKDRLISQRELLYIQSHSETTPRDKVIHPYKKILKSPPVWALGVGKFTFGWGFNLIIICLPLYVRDATGKNVDQVGLISAIPNFICIFMTPIVGVIMDFLQNHTKLRASQIHRIMMTFGFSTSCILLAVAALCNNFIVSMTCFVLIKLFLSFNFLILQLVCLYLAPKHSSILLGISAFWYVCSNIILPSVVGFVVQNQSPQEWSMCFLLSSGVLLFGTLVYWKFGSSDLQPWAVSPTRSANEIHMSR
ncbi:vesicular glutamate transporter 2-like [Planococcus citri]|uniref:vesicular glutamate transporter 2-like n=1 Tax=Planococcus citri TaxID=170843 RepID=UPI0031F7D475